MTSEPLSIRFNTRVVQIGDLALGGDYPVRVQSMTNTNTLNTTSTVDQAVRMIQAGCELVRISIPGMKEIESLRVIRENLRKKGYSIPLIADVHYQPKIAEKAAAIVEKVRINPGNYLPSFTHLRDMGEKYPASGKNKRITDQQYLEEVSKRLTPLVKICQIHGTAIRVGVNHGSLSERILERFGNTPLGMVESALEFARVCEHLGLKNLILSLKSSNTTIMIRSNRLLVERMKAEGMDYPIHLGVTEAGAGEDGRLKSAIGIGSLLADGIGNTIRVSLTEDPEYEIPVAYGILQAAGIRITKTEYIACPSCSRTKFNIQDTLKKIEQRTGHLTGLKIAVMGCMVNGPGEMADAHYGYVGAGKGKVMLYKGQQLKKKNIAEADAVNELIALIRESGDWIP